MTKSARMVLALAVGICLAPRAARSDLGHAANFEGQLDLVQVSEPEQDDINTLNFGENPFHSARVRLFADAPVQ